MPFLLIPNEVKADEAIIWVGVINEALNPKETSLKYGNKTLTLDNNWNLYSTKSGKNFIRYQHITLNNLTPATDYSLEFVKGNETFASAQVRTLPEDLPNINERPFNVLLASCFASSKPESVSLGSSYLHLQRFDPTDIKILCGDQVYLDDPWSYFLKNTHSFKDLEDILFNNYVRTWTQERPLTGFNQFLKIGANFFSSDDHEFWNNAPNKATLIRDSWFKKGRENWWNISKNLLSIFQSKSSKTVFNVGTLSFFIADTRINRDSDIENFMSPVDLIALNDWVENLNGVGVFVIGQPIFSKKAGFFSGRFADWNLPNYKQYKDLVRILMKTNHSILVLTGDVHYGRIAECQVKPNVYIYEVISSPTSLINEKVGGKWREAPDQFPVNAVSGTVQRKVKNFNYKEKDEHFLTLSFQKHGLKTRVVAKVCEIRNDGLLTHPIKINEFTLF